MNTTTTNTEITWTARNRLTCGDRPFFAWFDAAHGLVIHSWKAATISKVAGGYRVAKIADCTFDVAAVTATTRKAAVELFVAAYVVELMRPVEPGPVVLRPCGTCGYVECASRFDCAG